MRYWIGCTILLWSEWMGAKKHSIQEPLCSHGVNPRISDEKRELLQKYRWKQNLRLFGRGILEIRRDYARHFMLEDYVHGFQGLLFDHSCRLVTLCGIRAPPNMDHTQSERQRRSHRWWPFLEHPLVLKMHEQTSKSTWILTALIASFQHTYSMSLLPFLSKITLHYSTFHRVCITFGSKSVNQWGSALFNHLFIIHYFLEIQDIF